MKRPEATHTGITVTAGQANPSFPPGQRIPLAERKLYWEHPETGMRFHKDTGAQIPLSGWARIFLEIPSILPKTKTP